MDVAISRAGNVGSALAGEAVRAGHSVTITSANPAETESTARSTGARAVDSNRTAVERADLVILAEAPQATEAADARALAPARIRDVLSDWREAERELATTPLDSPARLRLEMTVRELRSQYRRLFDAAARTNPEEPLRMPATGPARAP